MTTNCRRTWI